MVVAIGAIIALRAIGASSPLAYVLPAIACWVGALESGIHPTLVGVALGLLTPAKPYRGRSVLETLEGRLHPVSSYAVIPVFAVANAGVVLTMRSIGTAAGSRIFLGVLAGLVVGKFVGITGASLFALRTGAGRLPSDVGARTLMGGAALAGVGFTVSLFITRLAFGDGRLVEQSTLGVLAGSAISAVIGAVVLLRSPAKPLRDRATG
jgi:NhaA family Na+:H+ antiporter